MKPCDHHKGLECNYGNDVTVARGICRGERGGGHVGPIEGLLLMNMNEINVLMKAKGS